jgi:Tol biopolymer transport system component
MSRWARFVDWCRRPSKVRIRSFNPKNIMVVELSVLIISLITSGTWLFQVFSITQPQYPSIFASMSGDGTKIAYTSYLSSGGSEVFVVNSDGTGLTQLTSNQALNFHASISDDGTKIAFHSNVDGDDEIFVINSDGTGLTQLTNNTATDLYASISNDGEKIAYTSNVKGDWEIFVVNLESNSDHMPLTMPETGYSFPMEYVAAGTVAVLVAVTLVVIFLVRKKLI